MSISSSWVDCCPPTGSHRSFFDLRLRLCPQFEQALTHNSGWILVHPRVSPFLLSVWYLRDQTRHLFRSPGWTVVHPRVSPFLIIGFLVLVGFVGCPCCFQLPLNHFIQLYLKEIVGGGRGDTYTFSYMISPDSITTTFEIQQAVSVS